MRDFLIADHGAIISILPNREAALSGSTRTSSPSPGSGLAAPSVSTTAMPAIASTRSPRRASRSDRPLDLDVQQRAVAEPSEHPAPIE